jgi:hypothetical protein
MADFHAAEIPWQVSPATGVRWWARLGDAKKYPWCIADRRLDGI